MRAEVESIDLPPGYTIEWGGEFEDSNNAQTSLIPGMVPALIIVALVVVALFNAFRPPIIIVEVIPFVIIGITFGLLITDTAWHRPVTVSRGHSESREKDVLRRASTGIPST